MENTPAMLEKTHDKYPIEIDQKKEDAKGSI